MLEIYKSLFKVNYKTLILILFQCDKFKHLVVSRFRKKSLRALRYEVLL
jgi:hypothetical protein